MRKSFVALALVLGSIAIPAAPAAAHHCGEPPEISQHNPGQDPHTLNYPWFMAQYQLCQLSHPN